MKRLTIALAAAGLALGSAGNAAIPSSATNPPPMKLWRLDCGSGLIKDFNSFFSDTLEYKSGPREVTDSCYLVKHGDDYLLWDSGFPSALKGRSQDMGDLVASLKVTVAEQLAQLKLKPADIDVVGISHRHGDHTGQAAEFASARLVIGKGDFESTAGENDPFKPWRTPGAKVTATAGDVDIFGDGSVVAVHTPGHTPDHLSLLVRLKSGPVLLTGDLYHATEAREMRGVPPFNTSRADTLASIDRFERLAKQLGAKVVIQHEPRDIALLPAFPAAAE